MRFINNHCVWSLFFYSVLYVPVFYLGGEERACCFTLIVFLVSCDCQCFMTLPLCAVGLSAVCDCGIS